MSEVSFLRHSGFVGPSVLSQTIVLIGAGAVGSNLALTAAKMGYTKFILFDQDIVEEHNLPNQAFFPKHVSMLKVEALKQILEEFNPQCVVETYPIFFESSAHAEVLKDFVVIATDNMKSRKDITAACELNINVLQLIEARLAFDYGEIHLINPLSIDEFENFSNTIVDDSKVPEGPCNLRICPPLVQLITSYMVQLMCHISKNNTREASKYCISFDKTLSHYTFNWQK